MLKAPPHQGVGLLGRDVHTATKLAPRRSQTGGCGYFNRRTHFLTRFGIGANQFERVILSQRRDRWRWLMIEGNCSLMLEWNGDWNFLRHYFTSVWRGGAPASYRGRTERP